MKNHFYGLLTALWCTTGMLLAATVSAQNDPDGTGKCTNCSCSSVFTACSSGRCCPPSYANCNCGIFMSSCGCIRDHARPVEINYGNIQSFVALLEGPDFTSAAGDALRRNCQDIITAGQSNNEAAYFEAAQAADRNLQLLSAGEKQLVNGWFAGKGAPTRI